MSNTPRRLLLVVLAAGLVGLVAWGFAPRPPLVDAAAVVAGPLRVTVEEEGKTRVRDRYLVSASVPGFKHRIELEVGDELKAGQVVASIEPMRSAALDPRSRAEAEARVEAAQSALEQSGHAVTAAEADAALAKTELERVQRLYAGGAAAKGLLDTAEARARGTEAAHRSAQFARDVARHQLEAARATLTVASSDGAVPSSERIEVKSPVAGRVLKLLRESEGVVAAGEPLLEVGDASALEVEVEVLSSDAVRLAPGTRTLLERWGGDAPLEGRVRRVEPVGFTKVSALGVEEQRVLTIVDLTSPRAAWERLGDGYRVEAVFVLWEAPDALQAPQSALFPDGAGGWWCYAVEGDVARRRTVGLGQRNGLQAQVLSGLAAGERVLTHPPADVTDGGRVRVQ